MPVQKGKSPLLAKYGAKLDQAVKAHAADETDYGGITRLPPGITNGVARLTQCYFKEFDKDTKNGAKKGDYYFRAVGVIVEPATVVVTPLGPDGKPDGNPPRVEKVAGLQTSIMEAVCDTKKGDGSIISQEEHVTNILNEMRKLGVNTDGAGGSELEALAAALQDAKPYFRVNTSVRMPRPGTSDTVGVWENWNGNRGLEDYTPPEAGGVEDNTGSPTDNAEPSANGAAEEPAEEFDEFGDLDSLAQAADADDDDAKAKLEEAAAKAGVPSDDVTGAENWAAVAEMIKAAGIGEEDAHEEPAAEEWAGPKKGEIYSYMAPDPKNPKKPKKTQVEVLAADAKKKTCVLKSCTNPKVQFKDVSWGKLQDA